MNAKKILSLVLAVALIVCAAFAITNGSKANKITAQLDEANAKIAELETLAADTSAVDALQASLDEANAKIAELEADTSAADLQAQLDEANAKVAELEAAASDTSAIDELQAKIDLYKPFYDAQVVISYDGGVIMLDEVMEQYAMYESYYAQSGIDLAAYGMDATVKQMAAQNLLDAAVLKLKAAELGFDQLDDETTAGLIEEAHTNFESYVESVLPNFQGEEVSEEEARANAVAYLESMGYTEQQIQEDLMYGYAQDLLYNHVIADVTIDDSDVQAAFDALVAEQEASYANDSAYNSARNNGEMIVWNPEGYRAVKHVLIKLSDEQTTAMNELKSTLSTLEAELAALEAPAEETEESEETAEKRTAAEINADIDAVQADIDAIYAELMPEAEEVISKFGAGTPFADLIAEHNDDPGMANEPTATNGYAVAATSTTWDPAFTAGAMSIDSVGGISEPVRGMYGIHVLYYESDIPAGPVDIETVREDLAASTLEQKVSTTYNDALDSWIAALNPVYSYENLQD